MSTSVVEKYIAKKKNDILDYAKILESIISIKDNKMWNNKKTFIKYSKDIIDIYAESYYFDNNSNRNNQIFYSNDNINFVLKSIIEFFKKNNEPQKIKEWKNETFLLSVIICTACYVDFATNVVDGNYQDTKNKFKFLLNYFKKTELLQVFDDKFLINSLFERVKKNTNLDIKYIELLSSKSAHNKYQTYTYYPLLYTFKFEYTIPGLEEKDKDIANSIVDDYEVKFKRISFDLLCTEILLRLISNEQMGAYLIDADDILLKRPGLLKIFNNRYFKDYIRLFVNYEEDGKYIPLTSVFLNSGGKVLYHYDGSEAVVDNFFTSDMDVLVNEEFMNNNQENLEKRKNNKINFIVIGKEN